MSVTREEAKKHKELLCGYWVSHRHADFSGPVAVIDAYLALLDERDRLERENEELEKESKDLEFFQKLWCEKAGLLLQWPHDEPFQRWFGMVIPQVLDGFRQSIDLESQLATLREENVALKENMALKQQWIDTAKEKISHCEINHEDQGD